METFVRPQDYLSKRGNIKYCWKVHVKRMKEIGKPYVDYNSFYDRVVRRGWNLYLAIHTPLSYKRMGVRKVVKIWLRTQYYRFIYLFKGNDRVRGSKGHVHTS